MMDDTIKLLRSLLLNDERTSYPKSTLRMHPVRSRNIWNNVIHVGASGRYLAEITRRECNEVIGFTVRATELVIALFVGVPRNLSHGSCDLTVIPTSYLIVRDREGGQRAAREGEREREREREKERDRQENK